MDAEQDSQIAAVIGVIQTVRPDILLINEFDYDSDGVALELFTEALAAGPDGLKMPHSFLAPSNTGVYTNLDLDGDGRLAEPEDAFGYGRFPGQYGMVLLSRFPVETAASATFRTMLWQDLPGALMPERPDGAPFPSADVHASARLSSKSHWDVAVVTPGGPLRLLASHPTPPVFDGPEDFNGRRNHDEIQFWSLYLNGALLPSDTGVRTFAGPPFVILGDLNADPMDGDGRREALQALLARTDVNDPVPRSLGAVAASKNQGGVNANHSGDPALDTADWNDERGPGNLRVDYVLPSSDLIVIDSGVYWPPPGTAGADLIGQGDPVSSDHRLVWVDIRLP
ncbi:endonuclease/exonuclease/phosphatase family protein [Algicella marina]|uniref:Endonuclease/exonuclease/phosphatase family protein n=2 Tax=Algicella marina TaxID=2683284 RepID=A0A6P1T5X7_9RHOB|nr:endonuclease/exonuclease/phosphatase family protein [Algicella marina]